MASLEPAKGQWGPIQRQKRDKERLTDLKLPHCPCGTPATTAIIPNLHLCSNISGLYNDIGFIQAVELQLPCICERCYVNNGEITNSALQQGGGLVKV